MKRAIITILVLLTAGAGFAPAQAKHPSELKYPALKYEPPSPAAFRVVYAGGLRAYVQPDKSLPLFNITAVVNCGDLYVPKDKTGLGRVLGDQLIKGGTATREGQAIEDRVDFLGGTLSFMVGERTASLSLSVLSKDLDEGLALFFDVLRNPAFREEPLKLAKARFVEQLRQANDNPSQVLSREFDRLLYGDNALTWQATKATYEGVAAADLKAFHARYFKPGNVILAVSGDFDKAALKAKIEKLTAGWKGGAVAFPALPTSFPAPEPGVYFIQKAINQGYISLGHLGLEDTNPDYYAVQVMNFILGGGSFTSRITSKVRSDEGLSYNQGSRFTYRWGLPGTFSGYVQTKSETVGYAISLILDEFDRIRREPVSDAEMETAVNYYLESFADSFQSPQSTMMSFANLEMTGKPMDYYKNYRARIQAVTKAKVQEAAGKYIRPDTAVILIVGDFEPCDKGGDKWPGPLAKLGKLHRIQLTDPMTGQETKTP
ncbi:MAG TPA: pitrilysin family protein [Candidatus Aminicenantes bacterium]|nr:pitrilysin family protein [Candidatus Aminicenantes bacterium]